MVRQVITTYTVEPFSCTREIIVLRQLDHLIENYQTRSQMYAGKQKTFTAEGAFLDTDEPCSEEQDKAGRAFDQENQVLSQELAEMMQYFALYHHACKRWYEKSHEQFKLLQRIVEEERNTLHELRVSTDAAEVVMHQLELELNSTLALPEEMVWINFDLSYFEYIHSSTKREQLVTLLIDRTKACLSSILPIENLEDDTWMSITHKKDFTEGKPGTLCVKITFRSRLRHTLATEFIHLDFKSEMELTLVPNTSAKIRSRMKRNVATKAQRRYLELRQDTQETHVKLIQVQHQLDWATHQLDQARDLTEALYTDRFVALEKIHFEATTASDPRLRIKALRMIITTTTTQQEQPGSSRTKWLRACKKCVFNPHLSCVESHDIEFALEADKEHRVFDHVIQVARSELCSGPFNLTESLVGGVLSVAEIHNIVAFPSPSSVLPIGLGTSRKHPHHRMYVMIGFIGKWIHRMKCHVRCVSVTL